MSQKVSESVKESVNKVDVLITVFSPLSLDYYEHSQSRGVFPLSPLRSINTESVSGLFAGREIIKYVTV